MQLHTVFKFGFSQSLFIK